MNYTEALSEMQKGEVVRRKFWKNIQAIALVVPEGGDVQPFFVGVTIEPKVVLGFQFTAADILASDWEVVDMDGGAFGPATVGKQLANKVSNQNIIIDRDPNCTHDDDFYEDSCNMWVHSDYYGSPLVH